MSRIDGFFPATAMPDADWWTALWPDPEAVLRALGIAPGMVVVDLCCGDGHFTAPLAKLVDGNVFALDIDPDMLERTRAALDRAGARALGLVLGDACDLPELVEGPVDCVLMANTFHGVPDKTALARAVARVLGPGGRFIIVNWRKAPRERTTLLGAPRGPATALRMDPEEVVAAVAPAGFTLERVQDLPPWHYGAILRAPRRPHDKRAEIA